MKASALSIYASAFVFCLQSLFAAESNATIKLDFSDSTAKSYWLQPSFASITNNPEKTGKVLQIDTLKSDAAWNASFKTALGMLKPNTSYIISARCKILDSKEDSFVLVLIRPFDANNAFSDLGQTISARKGKWDKIFLRFRVPDGKTDYAFQIHTSKKVLAIFDDISIAECPPEQLETVANPISPVSLPQILPKGADEFTIDLPANKNKPTESVEKFGASTSNPDNAKAFNDAIAYCAANGIGKLIVPKGTYRFTSDDSIRFDKLTDFEFDGQGSTFIFLKKKNSLWTVTKNQRVALRNFSIDWDWERDPLGSYLKVESIEPEGEYVDFRILDFKKYPKQNIRIATLASVDSQNLSPSSESNIHYSFEFYAGKSPAKYEWKEDNLLRIYAEGKKASFKKDIRVGMTFRMKHYYYDMVGIEMRDNEHLTLADINIYSCPGHGLLVAGDQHHWQFLRTNIIRPPGTTRSITCTADHFHVAQSKGYVKMEGCEFSFGGDDAINIHDMSAVAYKKSENSIEAKLRFGAAKSYHVGDPVELRNDDYSPTGYTSKIKIITPVNAAANLYEITFEDALPEEKTSAFILFNRRYGAQQIIIRNNYFHDYPRILLLGSNVTFEKNRLERGAASAIKIETGYTLNVWCEGYGASNIVIRDNVFDNVNIIGRYPNEKQPTIYLSSYLKTDPSSEKTSYPILRDILIEGNTFKNFPGAVAYICSTQNVFILNNNIENTSSRQELLPYRGSIVAEYSSNIFIKGNTWSLSKYMGKPQIMFDPVSTQNIHSWDNKAK